MPECECASARDYAAVAQNREIHVKSDFAERDDHAYAAQQVELALQIRSASANLLGQRLVTRRCAVGRGGDVGAGQTQSVIARTALGLRCESGAVQDAVEQVA